jgi:glutaconate CoA-transferase subunit B
LMGFDEGTKAMKLESLHPGVFLQQVVENTGFDLMLPELIPVTEQPTQMELDTLRSLDPDRRFL